MKKLRLLVSIIALLFVSVSFAADSPLVEAAKKERARRANLKPVKVFTNQDIEEFKARHKDEFGSEQPQATAEPEKQTSTPAANTNAIKPENDPEQEEYWRAKYAAYSTRLKEAQTAVEQIQSDINALTQAFYAEADGIGQRPLIEAERKKRLDDLETAKRELAEAKQAMDDLEEEARKAGAPPGWVRE